MPLPTSFAERHIGTLSQHVKRAGGLHIRNYFRRMTSAGDSSEGDRQTAQPYRSRAEGSDWIDLPPSTLASQASAALPSTSAKSAAHAHSKSPRPNYFLALQLSNSPAVIEAISRVQQSLIKHLPAVQAALVDPQSAHMTVMVAALQSEEEVQTAEKAMEALPAVLAQHGGMQGPLCVKLEGLSHFRHEVLFLDVRKGAEHDRLLAFARLVRDHMQQAGDLHLHAASLSLRDMLRNHQACVKCQLSFDPRLGWSHLQLQSKLKTDFVHHNHGKH